MTPNTVANVETKLFSATANNGEVSAIRIEFSELLVPSLKPICRMLTLQHGIVNFHEKAGAVKTNLRYEVAWIHCHVVALLDTR